MRPALVALSSLVLLSGCIPAAAESDGRSATVELAVFAAASLRPVLEEAEPAYEAASATTALVVSTDSSAALATQIEQGAPADVFLSADTAAPQRLVEAGLAAGRPVVFAANELAIVVPAGDPGRIVSPADLAKDGVEVIAAGADVPITRYAAELVGNLQREPGYPADFAAAYERNIVSREDNVTAVVTRIGLGEGDAAIVYATDAAAARNVVTIEIPDGANVRATYAGVLVDGSARQDEGRAFLSWLVGRKGQAVLARFGFLPPAS